jgi:uncharacterized protein (DUF2237 family)
MRGVLASVDGAAAGGNRKPFARGLASGALTTARPGPISRLVPESPRTPEAPMPDDGTPAQPEARNILGGALDTCSTDPMTGFLRDGCCTPHPMDHGNHSVCAVVTEAFLAFTARQGNDLATPRPEFGFQGLKPGDRWCLCAARWLEAMQAGVAPPIVPEATSARALDVVEQATLMRHARQ